MGPKESRIHVNLQLMMSGALSLYNPNYLTRFVFAYFSSIINIQFCVFKSSLFDI